MTYVAMYDSVKGSSRSKVFSDQRGSFLEGRTINYKTLHRDQFLQDTSPLLLPKSLFDRPGFYRAQIEYSGLVRTGHSKEARRVVLVSNWVILETYSCEPDN